MSVKFLLEIQEREALSKLIKENIRQTFYQTVRTEKPLEERPVLEDEPDIESRLLEANLVMSEKIMERGLQKLNSQFNQNATAMETEEYFISSKNIQSNIQTRSMRWKSRSS